MAAPRNEPCQSGRAGGDNAIGAACPECGHTNLVHPGRNNPGLDACAICEIEVALSTIKEQARL